jgi:DNA-binding XRE family transcriptional regulator
MLLARDVAEMKGISYGKMSARLHNGGWSIEEALEIAPHVDRRAISFNGESKTLAQWARDLGISRQAMEQRIRVSGWDIEKALRTPRTTSNGRSTKPRAPRRASTRNDKTFRETALGTRITRLRLENGLTQAELAKRAGTTPWLIGNFERGMSTPSVTVFVALARIFDVSLDELAGLTR